MVELNAWNVDLQQQGRLSRMSNKSSGDGWEKKFSQNKYIITHIKMLSKEGDCTYEEDAEMCEMCEAPESSTDSSDQILLSSASALPSVGNYRPQMKFGEGNVFTGISLGNGVGSQMHHRIGHMGRVTHAPPGHTPQAPTPYC